MLETSRPVGPELRDRSTPTGLTCHACGIGCVAFWEFKQAHFVALMMCLMRAMGLLGGPET